MSSKVERVERVLHKKLLQSVVISVWIGIPTHLTAEPLRVGIASVDVTPVVSPSRPVWLAGYGSGRQAAGIHDPLFATCLVLSDGECRVACVTVDVIGLQLPTVERVRQQLAEFDYVVISSTHNHEGPDTIGMWGKAPWHRGVDDLYLDWLIEKIINVVKAADQGKVAVKARFGEASDPRLVGDSRKPEVKAATLRVLKFECIDRPNVNAAMLVQWTCHPEALGAENTLITADFPAATIAALKAKYGCSVAYFSGEVGGLMAPPIGVIQDAEGKQLPRGSFEYAQHYGLKVADLAVQAVERAEPIRLTPLRVSAQRVAIPVQNPLYRLARLLGVVRRAGIQWTGDFNVADQTVNALTKKETYAVATEVACLEFGELKVVCIPGEIYPELVSGKFQQPVEPNVDFPDAELEPYVEQMMGKSRWMLFGLANDEIGYIIPKRQWDQVPPFAYGRHTPQYGEINSCGPEVGPIIMQALQRRAKALQD